MHHASTYRSIPQVLWTFQSKPEMERLDCFQYCTGGHKRYPACLPPHAALAPTALETRERSFQELSPRHKPFKIGFGKLEVILPHNQEKCLCCQRTRTTKVLRLAVKALRQGNKGVSGKQRCQERMALPLAVKGVRFTRRTPVRPSLGGAAWSAVAGFWVAACSRVVRYDPDDAPL